MTIFSTALSCNRSVGSIVLSNVHAFRVKASQIHQHYHNRDILVSTLCDFAADYQGKLCIQGGFDSLVARQFPVVHPVCAVALRICLTPEDEGTHELGLSIVDADGTPLDKERMPIKINFPVPAFPEGASFFTRNLIMNFQGLRFEKPGNYSIDLTVDGELASRVPFRVVQVQEEAAQA